LVGSGEAKTINSVIEKAIFLRFVVGYAGKLQKLSWPNTSYTTINLTSCNYSLLRSSCYFDIRFICYQSRLRVVQC